MTDIEQRYHQARLKRADIELEKAREEMRPHRMYETDIFYDSERKEYACRMLALGAFEGEEDIIAYGDTASEACDNFDHLWVHGE